MRELNPETSPWASSIKTNAILADIYDLLAVMNSNLIAVHTGKPAKKPKPYPRPGKRENGDTQHFGSGALPPDKLREWFDKKRAKKCQK